VAILKTEAIVLRVMDYSETSLIAWMYTREHGRVHVIAKGARRARSAFEGAIEPLVYGELVFYRKKRGAEGLETAKEFDPIDLNTGIRKDLPRLYRGIYLAELLTELSEPEVASPDGFAVAVATLRELARGESANLDRALFRAEIALLADAGLAPCLERCARCDRPADLEAEGEIHFSPAAGGVLCGEHAAADPAARRIRRRAVGTLVSLSRDAQAGPLPDSDTLAIRELLDAFLTHHLGKRLKLQRFLTAVRRGQPAGGGRG
jgi:DNA repair protein RecO (recombination protein O)